MSLLESVWSIVKGNISLVLGSVSAFLSVLLDGGTAVLNFILNVVSVKHICIFGTNSVTILDEILF